MKDRFKSIRLGLAAAGVLTVACSGGASNDSRPVDFARASCNNCEFVGGPNIPIILSTDSQLKSEIAPPSNIEDVEFSTEEACLRPEEKRFDRLTIPFGQNIKIDDSRFIVGLPGKITSTQAKGFLSDFDNSLPGRSSLTVYTLKSVTNLQTQLSGVNTRVTIQYVCR